MYQCLLHRIALRPFKTPPKSLHVRTEKYNMCSLCCKVYSPFLYYLNRISLTDWSYDAFTIVGVQGLSSTWDCNGFWPYVFCLFHWLSGWAFLYFTNTIITTTDLLMSLLCTEFLLVVQKLRIFILPSTQTPEALQTGYRGRWQKRFEVIAHFSGEKRLWLSPLPIAPSPWQPRMPLEKERK